MDLGQSSRQFIFVLLGLIVSWLLADCSLLNDIKLQKSNVSARYFSLHQMLLLGVA